MSCRSEVLWAALAAVLVTAAPATAVATDDVEDAAPADVHGDATKAAPESPAKPAEAKKGKKSKHRERAEKAQGGKSHADKSKPHDGASKSKDKSKTKKTAARAGKKKSAKKAEGKRGSKAASKAPQKPCFGPAITVDRGGLEAESFPLVDCAGAPIEQARQRLSILARPWAVARPELPEAKTKGRRGKGTRAPASHVDEISPGVRLLDQGLVTRVEAITRKFPGKTVSLVSGYRPQSRGSLHQTARAVDLRVNGVDNVDLAAFCRTLPDTGCGFYPNSSFVHIDVRAPSTGTVAWIDASGPGEAPKYVSAWPPPPNAGPQITTPPDDEAHEQDSASSPSAAAKTSVGAADDADDDPYAGEDPAASPLPSPDNREAAPRPESRAQGHVFGPTLHPALDGAPRP